MDGAALLEPGGEGGGRMEVKASLVCGANSVNRMEMLGAARLQVSPRGPVATWTETGQGSGENKGEPALGAERVKAGGQVCG